MKCGYCNKKVDFPFKCSFCSIYYCEQHRLPENHNCPEMWQVKIRSSRTKEGVYQSVQKEHNYQYAEEPMFHYRYKVKAEDWTSSAEIIHLTAGALIIMVVGLAWNSVGLEWIYRIFLNPFSTFISAVIFTLIFLSHELAHKIVARQYGLWAEFRINLFGAVLTIISISMPLIKIIYPGAVHIVGPADRKIIGVSALAGPLTSIGIASVILSFILFYSEGISKLLINSAFLAIWIAVLNLVPVGIFDGAKVFLWNKTVWAISFIVAVMLMFAVLTFSI